MFHVERLLAGTTGKSFDLIRHGEGLAEVISQFQNGF
jgi:hypothetical protein